MKLISLLPEEVRVEQKKRKKRVTYMISSFAVLLLMLMIFFIESIAVGNVYDDYNKLKNRKTSYENELNDLKEYDDLKQKISNMEKVAEKAYGKSVDWVMVLNGIGESIPGDVWLDGLDVTTVDNGYVIKLTGGAKNIYCINEWLEKIEAIPGIKGAHLTNIKNSVSNVKKAVHFEIDAEQEATITYDMQSGVSN